MEKDGRKSPQEGEPISQKEFEEKRREERRLRREGRRWRNAMREKLARRAMNKEMQAKGQPLIKRRRKTRDGR